MPIDGWTLGLQAVNFLVLIWLLRRFLYRPVLAALDRRREATARISAAAEDALRQATAAEADWHHRCAELDAERVTVLRQAEAEAELHRKELIASARAEAQGVIDQAHQRTAEEHAAVTGEVRRAATEIAVRLAGRLLDTVAPAVGAEPFLRLIEAHLDALPTADRQQLMRGLPAAEPVRVAVYPPLSDAGRTVWQDRLQALLGPWRFAFVAEPTLIAGARLVLPEAIVGADWADTLTRAGEELVRDGDPA